MKIAVRGRAVLGWRTATADRGPAPLKLSIDPRCCDACLQQVLQLEVHRLEQALAQEQRQLPQLQAQLAAVHKAR